MKCFALMTLQDRSMEINLHHSWIRLSRLLRDLRLEELPRFPTRFPRRFLRFLQRRRFSKPALRSPKAEAMDARNAPGVVLGSGWHWVFRWCS